MVCDDFAGYNASFVQGLFDIGCMAHARHKFFDLFASNVPIHNNQGGNQIRPWALGRSNWLLARSLRSGKRAAAIMSLIQSARLNGHDPYAYLKDVLSRLPTQGVSEFPDLLAHTWAPEAR